MGWLWRSSRLDSGAGPMAVVIARQTLTNSREGPPQPTPTATPHPAMGTCCRCWGFGRAADMDGTARKGMELAP